MPGKNGQIRPSTTFRLPAVLVAVSTSGLSSKSAGKTRTLMPVWDSSGESLNGQWRGRSNTELTGYKGDIYGYSLE
jgi:hypothetical protein